MKSECVAALKIQKHNWKSWQFQKFSFEKSKLKWTHVKTKYSAGKVIVRQKVSSMFDCLCLLYSGELLANWINYFLLFIETLFCWSFCYAFFIKTIYAWYLSIGAFKSVPHHFFYRIKFNVIILQVYYTWSH